MNRLPKFIRNRIHLEEATEVVWWPDCTLLPYQQQQQHRQEDIL